MSADDVAAKRARPRKKPACDRCKAKRVLCHPAEQAGESCPRCREKGALCITTPVVRRKPVRKPKLDATSPSTPARDHSQPTASRSPSLQPVDIPSPDQAYDLDSLPPPLLRSLVDDFIRLPQKHHPCVQAPLANLATSLRRTSYQFSQLSPSTRAFAAGVVALSALISLEPAIVGNGPRPASLESLSLEDDLADLGRRRTPTCNALRASAMKEAKAADSLTETTPENAATCYLLDALDMGFGDTFDARPSRPYSAAYFSHIRAIHWNKHVNDAADVTPWGAFLMAATLRCMYFSSPMTFSHQDELLLRGDDPISLVDMRHRLNSGPHEYQLAADCIKPWSVIVVKLARQLEATVSGAHARRQALNEPDVWALFHSLNVLEDVQDAVLSLVDTLTPPHDAPAFPSSKGSRFDIRDAATYAMVMLNIRQLYSMGYCALILSLHSHLKRRTDAALPHSTRDEIRAAERMELLRGQVEAAAVRAAHTVGVSLGRLPSAGHITHFRKYRLLGADGWVSLLLADIASKGIITQETAQTLSSFRRALDLITFSHPATPSTTSLMAEIDVQPHIYNLANAPITSTALVSSSSSTFADPLLSAPFAPPFTSGHELDRWFNSAMLAIGAPLVGDDLFGFGATRA